MLIISLTQSALFAGIIFGLIRRILERGMSLVFMQAQDVLIRTACFPGVSCIPVHSLHFSSSSRCLEASTRQHGRHDNRGGEGSWFLVALRSLRWGPMAF